MFKDVSNQSQPNMLDRRKIAIGFIAIIFIVSALAINSSYQINRLVSGYNGLFQNPLVISHGAKIIKIQLSNMNGAMQNVLYAKGHRERNKAIILLNSKVALIEKEFDTLSEKMLDEKQVIAPSVRLFLQWKVISNNIFHLLAEDKMAEAKVLVIGEGAKRLLVLQQEIESLEKLAKRKVIEYQAQSLEISDGIKLTATVLSILAILCVMYLMFEVWRAVSSSEKSRARRQKLIDEHILISILDENGNVEDISSALCKFFGVSKTELIDSPSKFFLGKGKKDQLLEKNILNMITQGKEWRGEISYNNAQGRTVWADSSILPSFDEGLNIIGYTNILHDLTSKKLANMDKLTGLLNRRSYDDILADQISIAVRNNYPLTLSILDIDYFKRFNDLYGHPEGDIALRKLSELLSNCMKRPSDFVFRIGGEEFAILISGLDAPKSKVFLDSIREQVHALQIPNKNSDVSDYLTVSMGAVVLDNDSATEQELYKRADFALYEAKIERNRIVVTSYHDDETK